MATCLTRPICYISSTAGSRFETPAENSIRLASFSQSVASLGFLSPRVLIGNGSRNNWNGFSLPASSPARISVVSSTGNLAPSSPPFNVVITGSTKGIGLSLAREFLRSGDTVVITSRSGERVDAAVLDLQKEFGKERVLGTPCDVSTAGDVRQLADFASNKLGHVDIWINNAGTNAYVYGPLIEADDTVIEEIVRTNVLGVMLCCREALRIMKDQPRTGHVFNMDGAGADGNPTPRFAAYGATKRSLSQFTKSIQAELRMLKVNNVVMHNLSPGMVTTELLMAGANTNQAKFFINALAEAPEDVASFLVPRVRQVPSAGSNQSTYIRFLTKPKAYAQVFARLLFKARKDKYVKEE